MSNLYECFFRGKRVTIRAATTYDAQKLAAAHFRARKSYDVAVVLAEKDGTPVVHTAVD